MKTPTPITEQIDATVGGEERPQGSVDAPRGIHSGMKHPDRHSQRKFDDDEERVETPDRIVSGRKPERQHETTGERHCRCRDHREDQPAADLAFDGIAFAGLGERPEPLPHDLEKPPPDTADEEAAHPQDHDGECGQAAEGGEDDQEFGNVDDE